MIMLLMLAAFMLLHYVVKYGREDGGVNMLAGLATTAALIAACVVAALQWAALLP